MSRPASVAEDISQGYQDEAGTDDENDVPVNKKTTFNGRLNQYFHASKNVAPTGESLSKVASTPDLPTATIKRKPESDSEPPSDPSSNASALQLPIKRPRTLRSSRSSPVITNLTPRITRSRSASSTTSLPPSTPNSPLTPSTTPDEISRSRSRRRQPSTPATSSICLLRDTIPPNLTLLLVGVNPGIMTGTTGFAYAHPSNLFWKLLHWSGITPIRHPPSDTYRLPELYNIGNTNIVERPTRDASMLSKAEMNAGVPVLEAKVAKQRPEAVCLVGKSIWEAVWRVRKGRPIRKEEFRYGWQDETENMGRCDGPDGWEGARVFVATTTSGLAAGMSIAEKQAVWNELGRWVIQRREALAGKRPSQ
ncbi:hypothetical protein KXX57_008755 [Aspergillus fumigatus]|nr:hypothetical protein KXX57_008755 [Aspergillus fumigatus]KAH2662452.1 hypothetical protein KXV32_009282 [Aspergillus fumigatus]KAH2918811.1 hypothetical protein KXW25_005829 [Aspergillus fumigatus]KAH3206123.1 hypothetical protein KXW62_003322 [Aspergillus fumigatus]KAH3530353.1 hypothetical protein KXV64_002630 [Aspergillus fumigatus]